MIRNKKGFTLIELIIVMAIIGILAVVAVIAIGSKSADARNARRLADMATVRTAMALMCSDGIGNTAAANTDGWFDCAAVGADNTEVALSTCTDTDIEYINFTNIKDPDADNVAGGACTEAVDDITCDYGITVPSEANDEVNPCDYDIYVAMDQTTAYPEETDRLHVTEAGIVSVD